MNRTPIEWVKHADGTKGFTWNPVVGCRRGCEYCYARDFARRNLSKCAKCATFEPHLHAERLEQPWHRKKPTTIFVGSICDLLGEWVPARWIEDVLREMRWGREAIDAPSPHRFLALTKNPKRYRDFDLPENLWCGVTMTTVKDHINLYHRMNPRRSVSTREIMWPKTNKQFLSLEPLLGDPFAHGQIDWKGTLETKFDWIIIGPLNRRGHDPVTKREWVEKLIEIAQDANVPVFLKDACTKIGYTMDEMIERNLRQVPWRV